MGGRSDDGVAGRRSTGAAPLVPHAVPSLMELDATYPARLQSATEARHLTERTLRSWGCDELTDTAALLVSELVVNAVSHAGSSATLRLTLTDAVLRVEVEDASPVPPRPRVATTDDSSGRGLMLVEALADRWGVRTTPLGKVVWFEIGGGGADRPPPPA